MSTGQPVSGVLHARFACLSEVCIPYLCIPIKLMGMGNPKVLNSIIEAAVGSNLMKGRHGDLVPCIEEATVYCVQRGRHARGLIK